MHFFRAASIIGFNNMDHQSRKELFDLEMAYSSHTQKYGLNYGTKEEYYFRRDIFIKKDKEIKYWNNKQDSFRLGHNKFSTWTDAEMNMILGGKRSATEYEPTIFDVSNLPDTLDWREEGAVNAVQDQ